MDTITIARIEREGQTLIIDPPFVLVVRPTTVIEAGASSSPCWEARVENDEQSGRGYSQGPEWVAGREILPRVIAPTREDLEPKLIRQLWHWWDHELLMDTHQSSPLHREAINRLRSRLKDANG